MKPLHLLLVATSLTSAAALVDRAIAQDLSAQGSTIQNPGTTPVASGGESVVVLGRGQSRQVQTLSRSEIQKAAAGTSPLKTLSKLPGVSFESSDALGAYEWSQQITVRGFNMNQLGYTLDGVPLGDLSYGNDDGLSIGRAVQVENNGPATLAQGTGSLGTASTNNLGGTFLFTTIDPTEKFGLDLAGSVGSSNTWRTFGRVNTGTLYGGGRAYVSYDYQDADKWKGYGPQKQQQANIKLIQPLGEHVRATVYADWSDRKETDYQDVSLALVNKFGNNLDNIANNYTLAKQIATAYQNGTTIPAPYSTVDDVYYNAGGLRKDVLGYGRLDYDLLPHLTGDTTIYGHLDSGQGLWATPYVATPAADGGSPISVRTTEYDIHREGILSNLTGKLGHHTIEGGIWFQNTDFEQARRYYGLGADAPTDFLDYYSNPFKTQWQYHFNTKTYQFHLQDTWRITPALKVNYGFKSVVVDNHATTVSGSPDINGSINASNGFLPQVGAVYALNHSNEIFADYQENMRSFQSAATAGPFSTTQAGFNAIKNSLKPEMSDTEEVGYRFHNRTVQATLAAYYVEFSNRLLTTTAGAGIVGNPSVLTNVGSVTSRGIEAGATWSFVTNWSLYGSWAYNDSHYDDNVLNPDGTIAVATAGKTVVAAPHNLGNIQLSYDDGSIWGNILGQYQSRRFYTYDNTSPVRGNTVLNLATGYRFHQAGWLNGLELQIDVTNLLDNRYISTIGTNGFTNSDPNGTDQTLQSAPPRMVFFTLRKHFG